jgi:hypothetical protein
MISSFVSSLADRIWPISPFAQELVKELTFRGANFELLSSPDSFVAGGHIHIGVRKGIEFIESSFAYGLMICDVGLHLVDGQELRLSFQHPPTDKPLNWREYELIEKALQLWLHDRWAHVRSQVSDERLSELLGLDS